MTTTLDVDALYRAEYPRLLNWFVTKVGHDAAPDLAQQAFVRVLVGAQRYREHGLATAWLYVIARRVLVDGQRRHGRSPDTVAYHDGAFRAGATHDAGGPAHLRRLAIDEALGVLTPEQRGTIVERFLHGRSRAQTSAVLGVPEDTVAKRQIRALHRLRHELGEGGVT